MTNTNKICLGDWVRLPTWTDSVIIVQDIGTYSFWGDIVDKNTGEVYLQSVIRTYSEPWEKIKFSNEG